jgi:predicted NAD/FAD-binding protein
MELASMLAHEPFGDRARSISPTIGAFLRTYNDGLDHVRRQHLYPVAAAIVSTAARRAVEHERANRCLAFARQQGARLAGRRAALGLATPGAVGAWAPRAALEADAPTKCMESQH